MQDRVNVIRVRMRQLEEELAQLERFPRDTFPEGTVIAFEMNFAPDDIDGQIYSYAAIKVNGRWYTTGPRSPKSYTWGQLCEWMSTRVSQVRLMKDGDIIVQNLREIEGTATEGEATSAN